MGWVSRRPGNLRVRNMTNSIQSFPILRSGVAVVSLFAALAIVGCKEVAPGPTPPPPPPPPPPTVAVVQLTPVTATLDIGARATLTATTRDAGGNLLAGRTITWNSSAPAVATVAAGVVTAVSQGNATITASSEGKSATASITVNPAPVDAIDLSSDAATLEISETLTLVATPRDATGNALTGRTISWSSSDPAIATVSDGLVTAVSAGLASITATSEGRSASAAITVNPAPHPCVSDSATGRLTYSADDNSLRYVTHGGWKIIIVAATITIGDPTGYNAIQNWGQVNNTWHAHENFNGKHVKNFKGAQRTHILSDSSKITINGRLTAQTSQVSIYDNDQTHRFIIRHTNNTYELVWSCALPMFGDAEEHDGETSSLFYDDEGLLWYNIYQEDADTNGLPKPRQHGNEPLARMFFDNPNQVNDYYDDPTLGYT